MKDMSTAGPEPVSREEALRTAISLRIESTQTRIREGQSRLEYSEDQYANNGSTLAGNRLRARMNQVAAQERELEAWTEALETPDEVRQHRAREAYTILSELGADTHVYNLRAHPVTWSDMQRAGLGIEVRRGPGMITVLPDSGLAVDQIVAGGATRREAWIPPRPMNAAEKSLYAHLRGRGTDIAESNDTAMDIDAPPAASGTLRRIQMLLRPWHKETANSRTPS